MFTVDGPSVFLVVRIIQSCAVNARVLRSSRQYSANRFIDGQSLSLNDLMHHIEMRLRNDSDYLGPTFSQLAERQLP